MRAKLAARRIETLAPELPATGADSTDPATVTLEGWARFLVDRLSRNDAPATLVGHSRAGLLLSRVAELVPERIRRLVYVAAYLLPAGGTVAAAAREDEGSLIAPNMIAARAGVSCGLRPDVVRDAFYGCCAPQVADRAIERLAPEPLEPLVTPLRVTPERFGRVPRAYVECTHDRAVTLASQRRMQSTWPCDPVITLEADHSPFLSRPDELAEILSPL